MLKEDFIETRKEQIETLKKELAWHESLDETKKQSVAGRGYKERRMYYIKIYENNLQRGRKELRKELFHNKMILLQ